ncbi:DNA polymerase Y family protein [Schaalia sp. ZJ405]|uniref:DNA polymerase Y family protein n=1 Tax=Schaalia sp. ZJ405 TaxID=2709403 RepID=UPI0013ED9550|nr:DNA polymerase Y family protein [Schaalia sp. ZJ405]QPK82060.1 DNA polymerase Y family protein [Schaalia sp. ZJ405]
MRYLVLWVPDWPTHSLSLDCVPGSPVIVTRHGRVLMMNHAARGRGIRRDMRVSTAQLLCPEVIDLPRDPDREAVAFDRVFDAFTQVAARAAIIRPGLAWAPAIGPARWAGGEYEACEKVIETVTDATGIECFVGVASGPLAAIEAARRGEIVTEEETQTFLTQIPLNRTLGLVPSDLQDECAQTLRTLETLGVRTCAQLVNVGKRALVTRFGAAGQVLFTLCSGGEIFLPQAPSPLHDITIEVLIEQGSNTIDSLALPLRRGAADLVNALDAQSLFSDTLVVTVISENGDTRTRTWQSPDLMNVDTITDRVRWQLKGWAENLRESPTAQVSRVILTASGPRLAVNMATLWGREDSHEKILRTGERIQSLLGVDGLTVPHLHGGMDPRARITQIPWGTRAPVLGHREGEWEGSVTEAPDTLCDRPIPVEVFPRSMRPAVRVDRRGMLTGEPERMVLRARSGAQNSEETQREDAAWAERVLHDEIFAGRSTTPITMTDGPWVIHGRWWEDANTTEEKDDVEGKRAYIRVLTAQGVDILLVFRKGGWAIEGICTNETSAHRLENVKSE